MWKGLKTNLKTGLNDLTSKIANPKNSKDLEDDQEDLPNNSNPINKPSGRTSKKNKMATSNPHNIFSTEESSEIPPVRIKNSRPKHLKKAQKGDEASPMHLNHSPKTSEVQGFSEVLGAVRNVSRSLPDLSEKEVIEVTRPMDLKDEVDEIWGIPSPKNKRGNRLDTEIEELRVSLKIKEQALGQFVEENDKLIKERNELQEKVNALQNKPTEEMKKYIEECVGQYKTEIAEKVMEEVNKEILQQIEEEGDLSEEVKSMMNVLGVKQEMIEKVTDNTIPIEKIIKNLCDEEELGRLKEEIQKKEEEIRILKEKLKENEESRESKAFEQEIEEYKVMIQAKSQDIEKLIIENDSKDAQIKSLEERLSTESLVNNDLRTKYEDIVNENNNLVQQMNKENQQYNHQAQELDKIQEEFTSLQNENEGLKEQNLDLHKAIENLNKNIESQEKILSSLQGQLDGHQEIENKYLEEMTMKTEEIEGLKGRINKMKEDLDGTNGYINKLEAEVGVVPELNFKIETQQAQIATLNELINEKDKEINGLNVKIEELSIIKEENKQEIVNEEITEGQEKSTVSEELKERNEKLEKENMEYKEKLKQIEERLQEGAKTEKFYEGRQDPDGYLVDKRILGTFLLRYYDGNATNFVRQNIMESMASLLGFDDDERVKVGLGRVNPIEEEEKTDERENAKKPQKSLTQRFMSFLQDE